MSDVDSRPGTAAVARAEPRALRTRTKVVEALMDAVAEVPLAELSVAELCRRAGVHRVTFYGHWPDIESLAVDAFGELVDRLAAVPDVVVVEAQSVADLAASYRAALRDQLTELLEHRAVYRELLAPTTAAFHSRIEQALRARAESAVAHLVQLGAEVPAANTAYPATVVAGGVAAAFARWTASDDEDIEGVARAIEQQLPGWWP